MGDNMAYTYDDFLRSVNQAGMLSNFSQWDLQLAERDPASGMQLLAAKQQWAGATDDAGRAAANQLAEGIRKNASSFGLTGYTGGSWGNEYNPIQSTAPEWIGSGNTQQAQTPAVQTPSFDTSAYQVQPYQSSLSAPAPYEQAYKPQIDQSLNALMGYENFSWDKEAPEYVNQYADLIASLHGNVVNRDQFSYDHQTDPMWQAYAKQYRREGDRATQDAMGAAAMRSGGVASTAAVTAAGQAGDNYASRLMDALPTMQQNAYNRYLNDFQMDISKLDSTRGLESDDYNKYQVDLGQYNTDRNLAYNAWAQRYNQLQGNHSAALGSENAALNAYQTNLGQYNADRNFEYGAYRDQVGDAQWRQNFDYGMTRDNVSDQRYNSEWQYNVGRDAISDARYADETAYNREQDAYARELAAAKAARGGYAGNRSGGVVDTPTGTPRWVNEYASYTPGMAAAGNMANTPPQETVYVEGYGWLDPASLQQLLYTGAIVERIGTDGRKIYMAR